jgi:hypothetical protein
MSLTIISPREYQRHEKIQEAPRRPATRMVGGWIADITALRQCVLLCEFCQAKFHPKSHKYRPWRQIYVTARCDACKQVSMRCTTFLAEETYNLVLPERGRRGRWAN